MIRISSCLTILAFVVSFHVKQTIAQQTKSEKPDAVKNLEKFIGTWDGNATLTIDGVSHKFVYYVNCKMTSGGNGLRVMEWFTDKDLGSMKGDNLAGYNPYDMKIHWFSVDNMGTTHEHTGEWLSPDHLFMEHDGLQNGKSYIEKIDFTFVGKNEMSFKMRSTLDGADAGTGEAVFHKKMKVTKK